MNENATQFSRRMGFTLVEMTTSLLILSVLLLACGSIVALAAYSTNKVTVHVASQIAAGNTAAQMRDDLNVAMNFTERTATATTFTVPDRTSSGSPQQVRYAWTGAGGLTVTRQFNGGAAVPILLNVQSFGLNYFTRIMGPAPGPTEQVIFQHSTLLLGSAQDYQLDKKNWASQYFVPNIPMGATSWTLTRVKFMLSGSGTLDTVLPVLVVMPDSNFYPNGAVLGQTIIYSSALDSSKYEMVTANFTGLSGLNPNQGLCIEIQLIPSHANDQVDLQYETSLLNIFANTTFATTSKSGSPWMSSLLGSNVAMMTVYGTVP